ncbi:MAG: hypothetical protein WBA74_07950 [Cyclobacteriaceae bacterium]
MNKYRAKDIQLLIEELAVKSKEDLAYKGFISISEKLGAGVGEKYLYDKYKEVSGGLVETVKVQRVKLDAMLNFLGFKKLSEFLEAKASPVSDILRSCVGVWINYVRQNSEQGILYRSPVEIKEEKGKVLYKLGGPHYTYEGIMTLNNGVLNVLFRSEKEEKQFHHVYRIGQRINPKVLQGIFSGVSTEGHPIGGRTVLIKSDLKFEEIPTISLKIKELIKSTNDADRKIAGYFKDFADNNLRINQINTFDIGDLG